jgi:oligopeptide transport system permease protein
MLDESFLSFLGLGVQAPAASWGTLVSEAAQLINPIHSYAWMLFFPGAMMALTLLALNFLGDGLRDALDPRSAGRQ